MIGTMEQRAQIIKETRREYGVILPCATRKSLEDCFIDQGQFGIFFYFNDTTGNTHAIRAALDSIPPYRGRPFLRKQLVKDNLSKASDLLKSIQHARIKDADWCDYERDVLAYLSAGQDSARLSDKCREYAALLKR